MPFEEKDNRHDIIFGDIFYLNYYDINVFFQVCKTSYNQVAIYELEKKRIDVDKEKVCPYKRARKPLLIIKNNCYRKSTYWVDTDYDDDLNKIIYLNISMDSPLYKLAQEKYLFPNLFVSAICLEDEQEKGLGNYYFEVVR